MFSELTDARKDPVTQKQGDTEHAKHYFDLADERNHLRTKSTT